VYEVKLIYNDTYRNLTVIETQTYCATVELFLKGIHTTQSSATRIAFESERDRMLGLLYLAGREAYTPVYAELVDVIE
jgi:hypothetical protein